MASWNRFLFIALVCLAARTWADDRHRDHFKSGELSTTFPILIHEDLIYVPLEINGRQLKFVLDSGSSRTLVDTAQLKDLNLKEVGSDSLQGAGQGRVPIRTLDGFAIRLPGLEMYVDRSSAVDLSPVNKGNSQREDGLLGYPFLSRYVVTINYQNETMTITTAEKFVPPTGATPLPIEIRHGWPFIKGAVKPSEDVTLQDKFFIDSGSSDAVDHPIATQLQSRKPTETGVGLGTPTTGSVAKLWGFQIGPYLIHNVEVACCGSSEDTKRMFGGEILSRFTVIFDYPHGQILLIPNRRYAENPN